MSQAGILTVCVCSLWPWIMSSSQLMRKIPRPYPWCDNYVTYQVEVCVGICPEVLIHGSCLICPHEFKTGSLFNKDNIFIFMAIFYLGITKLFAVKRSWDWSKIQEGPNIKKQERQKGSRKLSSELDGIQGKGNWKTRGWMPTYCSPLLSFQRRLIIHSLWHSLGTFYPCIYQNDNVFLWCMGCSLHPAEESI